MPNRKTTLRHGLLLAGMALGLLAVPSPGRAEVLYKLDTTCTLKGGAPVPCSVEAVDEGAATLYRHRIGAVTEIIRITDAPMRMTRWNPASKKWQPLQQAGARFSTNTVCFNGLDVCAVNPNYLNSVRQNNTTAMDQRDLVRVHFGATGRIDLTCYDEGCALVQNTAVGNK